MNTNDAEFFRKLRSTFKIEANEHLRTISLSLLELEHESTEEEKKSIIELIHREFHSLKGAARAVSVKEIESICHTIESIFSKIKKGNIALSTEMLDIFNAANDSIEDILSLPEGEIKDISVILEELTKIKDGDLSNKVLNKPQNSEYRIDKSIESNISISPVIDIEPKTDIESKIDVEPKINIKSNNDITPKYMQEKNVKAVKVSESKAIDTVRVSKAKLDSLLIQGEEMLYSKLSAIERAKEIRSIQGLLQSWKKENDYSYIEMLENNIDVLLKSAENDEKTIETMTDTFMEDIKDLMLLPFSSMVEIFPKMVRDLSRQLGKEIEFISKGTKIEIDRRILEDMKDPLMHIIRNCVDHGIEKPEEREKFGKPIKGTIGLNIMPVSSDRIKVQVWDDGSGIDISKVKEKVVRNKLLQPVEVNNIDDESAKMLIFKSGISTSDIITDISGRGLGLAIVQEKVQKLEGTINVKTENQKGTTFNIILPITISTNRGIIVKSAEQNFVIPTGKVEKVTRIKMDEIKIVENRSTILLDEYIIPIVDLKDILEIENENAEDISSECISIVVVNDMERRMAFRVDEIIVEQEVLVKRFNKQLRRVRNIAGATILGSGDVVPILDVQDLIKSSLKQGYKYLNIINKNKKENIEEKSIIVVEDSITSRTLLKNILESQGYSVKTAVDGLQGWELLKSEKFDIVITDVEMPGMDGFELTSKIRSDSETCELPVILVTSLESKEHKERGIDVGASAYIVKSDFKQSNLLEIIKRLI
jgi:Chemotaxis protein histidine kinase and related kinases